MRDIKLLRALPICAILAIFPAIADSQHNYKYYILENYCNGGRGEGSLDLSQQPLDYGIMQLTTRDGYAPNMDCYVKVTAPPGKGMVVRINYVEIYKPLFGSCSTDRLQIYTEEGKDRQPVGGYICGTGKPEDALHFEHGVLALHFISGNWDFYNRRRGFELVFTSYRKPLEKIGNKTVEGSCRDGEFECRNRPYGKMCIPGHLRCDREDNCGDYSDESRDLARCPYRGLTGLAVAGIVLGVLGFFVLLCVCVACITRCSHRQKESERIRAGPGVAMVHMPVVETSGGIEPPPMYTTTTAYHGFSNPGFVAPPPYTVNAATPATNATTPAGDVTPAAVTAQPAPSGSAQVAGAQCTKDDPATKK